MSELDRFECYEVCVQSPRHVAAFLRAVHGGEPVTLREDFCGTAALSRRWVEDGAHSGAGDGAKADAVDLDPECVAKAGEKMPHGVRVILGDSTRVEEGGSGPGSAGGGACDVVFVGNFSIGYLHTREALVQYLKLSRERLGGHAGRRGGIFVCDTYGGASAYKLGSLTRSHVGPAGEIVQYHWAHEEADPLTGMVVNSISFRVERDGEIVQELRRAFEYRWRLWGIAEVREAMREAGFVLTEVYADCSAQAGEKIRPITEGAELSEDWIVLIVGRV